MVQSPPLVVTGTGAGVVVVVVTGAGVLEVVGVVTTGAGDALGGARGTVGAVLQ